MGCSERKAIKEIRGTDREIRRERYKDPIKWLDNGITRGPTIYQCQRHTISVAGSG
jgi:hypothetical protein